MSLRRAASPYDLPESLTGIVVLPRSVEDGVGVYSNDALTLVKELRAAGVDVDYLQDSERRHWRVLMGDMPVELAIAIGGTLVGGAMLDGLKIFLADRFRGHHMKAKIVRIVEEPDGRRESTWYDFEGDGADVGSTRAMCVR